MRLLYFICIFLCLYLSARTFWRHTYCNTLTSFVLYCYHMGYTHAQFVLVPANQEIEVEQEQEQEKENEFWK